MAGDASAWGWTRTSRIVRAMSGMFSSQLPIKEKYMHQKTLPFCSTKIVSKCSRLCSTKASRRSLARRRRSAELAVGACLVLRLTKYSSYSFPICGAWQATLAARGPHFRKRCWAVRCLKNDDEAAAERDGEKAATGFTTVIKFEGSSVASAKRMAKVADLVLGLTKGKERPIVLLSAMGNTTNNLIQAGEKAVSFAFSSVSEIQEVFDIMDLHLRTIDELGLDSSIISGLFEELEQLLKRIATMEVLTQTTGDELVSIGECMSTTIFAAYLNKLGKIKARQYGAFDIGLITPIDLSDANVLELTCAAVVKRLLEDWSVEPAIPIVAGFLGKGCKSYARGRNDLIAATIAKALGLSEIQVWKDVDGLLTRDLNKYFTSELEADLQIIKNDDLEELRELDSGAYGTVYHAKWKGTDVAVKFLKKNCFKKLEHAGFWQEIMILSKLRHPNVLPFYGVVLNGQGGTTLGTVTEFMVDGSLRHVLQHKAKYLDDHKRLIIATDAALGVHYMHSKDIVHFDLKSGNLLVNLQNETRPICKVGDFGLSKIRKGASVSGFRRGTVRWMAPELMIVSKPSNKVSTKVDVYSFGIVMWEILTGELPYNSLFDNDLISWGVVNNKLRPLVPESCDPEWRMLMEQCWAHDPAQRPDFSEIVLRLRAMSTAANYS